jgi:hypothetical protein
LQTLARSGAAAGMSTGREFSPRSGDVEVAGSQFQLRPLLGAPTSNRRRSRVVMRLFRKTVQSPGDGDQQRPSRT